MTLDLKYYVAVFFQRFHYFFLVFATIFAASITAAFKLPPVYDATSRLLLESSQIPDQLAAPTVNTAALEQLQVIEQRLMTRDNLLDIARKLNVFAKVNSMSPDEIVKAMRDHTKIDKETGNQQATLMTITFEAGTAQAAAGVVNEYVTRILSDSVAARTEQAQQTLQFFKQEVDRLAVDLSNQSAKILDFQNKNTDSLPSTLSFRLSQQAALQAQLGDMDRTIATLKDKRQHLVDVFRTTGQVEGAPSDGGTPESRLLASLRSDLANSLAVLSPENPKVKILQARIDQLEQTVKDQASDAKSGAAPVEPKSLLDIQTGDIDSQIAKLQEQRTAADAQLSVLKDSIDRTASTAVTLDSLNRDYDNIQTRYKAASDRLAAASTGERIEVMAKGQRIAVLDPATVPDAPSKPNRRKIAALGFLGGMGAGVGMIVLLELLNGSVRRPIELSRQLGITAIGTIPYYRTPGELARRRTIIIFLIGLVCIGLPLAIYAVDAYYLPLDLLLAKISDKLGL